MRASTSSAFALEQVTLRRGDAVLLDGVTCEIAAGACTALIGSSGAGKSTLLRLLNRLDEPTSGVVRFHGEPLPDLDVLALRRRVGLVGQRPVLLTDRVLDDLRAGRPGLTEEEGTALLDPRPPARRHAAFAPPQACRAGSPSGSAWRGRWRSARRCCCWTSRPPLWTR